MSRPLALAIVSAIFGVVMFVLQFALDVTPVERFVYGAGSTGGAFFTAFCLMQHCFDD
ncbi:MAG: hypothetical protein WBG89_13110 [Ornithinimicrobium sp.]